MENIPGSLERSRVLLRALGDYDVVAETDAVIHSVRARIRRETPSFVSADVLQNDTSRMPDSTNDKAWTNRVTSGRIASLRRTSRWLIGGAITMATLLFCAGLLFSHKPSHTATPTLASTMYREFATRNGQRATVDLPDGTHVVLNAGSRIRMPESFGVRARAVHLEGEAQFTVSHDRARPFVVYSQGAVIKDLATVFTVRGFPGEAKTTVYVAAGAVAVDAGALITTSTAILQAGDLATITPDAPIELDHDVSPSIPMAWVYGRLVFHDLPLHEVLRDLGRWFDLAFVLTDPALGARRITTQVSEGNSSQDVLDGLADVLGARVSRIGKTVTISPKL